MIEQANVNKDDPYSSRHYIRKAMRTDLDLQGYQKSFERTGDVHFQQLEHAAYGLVTEAGEFADSLKKTKFYGKPLDKVNLVEELGDILWYVARACHTLDVDFETLQAINIAKLAKRYPEKFSDDKAVNRDVEAERRLLEEHLNNN